MTDKVQKIREEVEKRYEYWKEKESNSHSIESEIRMSECQHLLLMLNSLQEEPVSEELEGASKEWLKPQLDKSYESYGEGKMMELTHFDGYAMLDAIEFGAKWQKEQFEKDYTNLCKGIATAKGLAVAMAYDKGMADAREQMMANSADAIIGLPYENKDGGYTHLVDVSRPLPVGNNKIAIIFKEE